MSDPKPPQKTLPLIVTILGLTGLLGFFAMLIGLGSEQHAGLSWGLALTLPFAVIGYQRKRQRQLFEDTHAVLRELQPHAQLTVGASLKPMLSVTRSAHKPLLEVSLLLESNLSVSLKSLMGHGWFNWVELQLTTPLPPAIMVHRRSATGWAREHPVDPELPLFEADFEETWRVFGPPAEVYAYLHAPLRSAIAELAHYELALEGGGLRLGLPRAGLNQKKIKKLFEQLFALERLCAKQVSQGLGEALLAQAQSEAAYELRQQAFDHLAALPEKGKPLKKKFQELAQRLLHDARPALRLSAARAVGPQAQEVLFRLCRDPSTPVTICGEAWTCLRSWALPAAQLESIWTTLWPRAQGTLRTALLTDLTALPFKIDAAVLAEGAGDPQPLNRRLLAEALGATEISATPLLLPLLADEIEVAQAAIEALAQIGGTEALGPLKLLSESMLSPTALRHAALQALQRIEERRSQRGTGGLSLAESGPSGGLSVAESGETGGLSLAQAPAQGGLSAGPASGGAPSGAPDPAASQDL